MKRNALFVFRRRPVSTATLNSQHMSYRGSRASD